MRKIRVLPAMVLACLFVAVDCFERVSAAADQPLNEENLRSLLELKIDDDVIIARIKKAGLAFAGDEEALKRLAEAGASQTLRGAVREASARQPTAGAAAITYADVLKLLQLQIPEEQILKRPVEPVWRRMRRKPRTGKQRLTQRRRVATHEAPVVHGLNG